MAGDRQPPNCASSPSWPPSSLNRWAKGVAGDVGGQAGDAGALTALLDHAPDRGPVELAAEPDPKPRLRRESVAGARPEVGEHGLPGLRSERDDAPASALAENL